MTDIFDTNQYAHDPRNDFLNWSVVDAGTFDYAADAWGFTYGAAVEWYQDWWTIRSGLFDLSTIPNSKALDTRWFDQYQYDEELEERHTILGEPGKLKLLGFLSHARMGAYDQATAIALQTGTPADIAAVRSTTARRVLSQSGAADRRMISGSSREPGGTRANTKSSTSPTSTERCHLAVRSAARAGVASTIALAWRL